MGHYYEVNGPKRDYDVAFFCEDHNNEAVEFASEWLGEAFDSAEVDEEVSVQMKAVEGKLNSETWCMACMAKKMPEPTQNSLQKLLGTIDDYCFGIRDVNLRGPKHDKEHGERFGRMLKAWKEYHGFK